MSGRPASESQYAREDCAARNLILSPEPNSPLIIKLNEVFVRSVLSMVFRQNLCQLFW
jgi:hypothetical protein